MTSVDGRTARAQRTQRAVVEALVDLLTEGDEPSAARIAERAGVSLRSLYVHFATLEDLYRAAGEVATERAIALLEPIDPAAPRVDRIRSLCRQRGRLYEELGPLRRAAARRAGTSPALAEQRRFALDASRDQVARVFAAELAALPTRERRRRVAALDASVSGESWDLVRTVHGLSAREAEATLVDAVVLLLGDR